MNMQFGFGGFNPFTGMGGMTQGGGFSGMGQGMGGFNPYSGMMGGFNMGGMGGFNPYGGMMGGFNMGGMGGFNPYSMGMYGGYPMIDPSQFFNNYTFPPMQAMPVQSIPETPTTQAPTEQAPAQATPETPQPFQFGQKFGMNALQGKGFAQGGINQLKQAGIVQNKQQANQMLKDFQTTNAGKDVTQAQFQDFARGYKPPAQTFAVPAAPAVVANNVSNIKTSSKRK
jgi:hypothetical protein